MQEKEEKQPTLVESLKAMISVTYLSEDSLNAARSKVIAFIKPMKALLSLEDLFELHKAIEAEHCRPLSQEYTETVEQHVETDVDQATADALNPSDH